MMPPEATVVYNISQDGTWGLTAFHGCSKFTPVPAGAAVTTVSAAAPAAASSVEDSVLRGPFLDT